MTLQDKIERVNTALNEIDKAKVYWLSAESDATATNHERARRRNCMWVYETEFRRQTANVRDILAAHANARKHVEQAHDKLASLMPSLRVMLETDSYVMRTVEEVHVALMLALEGM